MPVISLDTQRAHAYKSINDWCETLRFRSNPGDATDPGYDVTALVTRNDAAALDGLPASGAPAFKVMVVHEANRYSVELSRDYNGIHIDDLRRGISTLDIAKNPGGTATPHTVRSVDDSDQAVLYLECR